MVSKKERTEEYEDPKYGIICGIYRVVKSIDDKVEGFLEEIREFAEMRSEDYFDRKEFWDENGYGPI